jgi:hypothetical protein
MMEESGDGGFWEEFLMFITIMSVCGILNVQVTMTDA